MKVLAPVLLLAVSLNMYAQPRIISGPMLGPVEFRDAKLWLEVSADTKSVSVQYNPKSKAKAITTLNYKGQLGNEFNPLQFTLGGLDFNTTYQYKFLINGKVTIAGGEFTTKDIWQWRKPVPNFSFITGSCSYFNQPEIDRKFTDRVNLDKPAKPYGGDSTIFETMARENAKFMLWLGDNWYTREVDYYSEWGLWYRAHHDRAQPVLQKLLKAMPQLATWDDHDYGPNDIGKSYILKDASRRVFMNYFCNSSYGENGQGIYTMHSWADVDLFLTDDRWFRSEDKMKDSVDGHVNTEKRMLGPQQMEWLKNALLFSTATFKIIVVGSQVLNRVSPFEKLRDFPVEYEEMMNFLKDNPISGVLFLTGDRHHSEIIREERAGIYPLYDITVSPLTSSIGAFAGPEKNNPYRVFGIDQEENYARFSFSGPLVNRKLNIEFFGASGNKLGEWSVSAKDLKKP